MRCFYRHFTHRGPVGPRGLLASRWDAAFGLLDRLRQGAPNLSFNFSKDRKCWAIEVPAAESLEVLEEEHELWRVSPSFSWEDLEPFFEGRPEVEDRLAVLASFSDAEVEHLHAWCESELSPHGLYLHDGALRQRDHPHRVVASFAGEALEQAVNAAIELKLLKPLGACPYCSGTGFLGQDPEHSYKCRACFGGEALGWPETDTPLGRVWTPGGLSL